jgi:hypothetical protein
MYTLELARLLQSDLSEAEWSSQRGWAATATRRMVGMVEMWLSLPEPLLAVTKFLTQAEMWW